jgi:hypothetical protein
MGEHTVTVEAVDGEVCLDGDFYRLEMEPRHAAELARRLDRAAVDAGGPGVTDLAGLLRTPEGDEDD